MNTKYGGIFVLHRDGRPGLLLTDAVGIEKAKPLIESFMKDFSNVNRFVQVNLGVNGFLFKAEMDEWDKDNLRFSSYYAGEKPGFYNLLNQELKKIMFQTGMTPNIYISGREEFMEEVYSGLEHAGVNTDNLIVDGGEAPSCGGACNSCHSDC